MDAFDLAFIDLELDRLTDQCRTLALSAPLRSLLRPHSGDVTPWRIRAAIELLRAVERLAATNDRDLFLDPSQAWESAARIRETLERGL